MYGSSVLVLCGVMLFNIGDADAGGGGVVGAGRAPLAQLNDGHFMPRFGLGTYLGISRSGVKQAQSVYDEVERAVEWAIDAGYRHVDTAARYDTEAPVGRALATKIREGAVRREDLFITTKLWNDAHAQAAVMPALRKSLERLGLDYVDLYLIHSPVGMGPNGTYDSIDYVETWKGMVEAKRLGLARSIGVSNLNKKQLARLVALAEEKPAVLQIELNLTLQQPELRALCEQHGIIVTAYTPLGTLLPSAAEPDSPPPRVSTPELAALARKHNKTPTQIALRYLVELGAIPIPKSVTKKRIEENIDIFDFELTEEDKTLLRSYDQGYSKFRRILSKAWAGSPFNPLKEE